MGSTYDFIVVGGGPAGCTVAAGLMNSPKKPSVLLIEAGGANADRNLRVDGQRSMTIRNNDMNWAYKSAPQEHARNRETPYPSGRGMGGGSAVNYAMYTVGARDDYDEWARITGDNAFDWEHMQTRLKNLESFKGETPPGLDKYASPRPTDHGTSGPLKVGYANEWEEDIPEMLDCFHQAGYPLNPDHNSGNPIGISPAINSSQNGVRSTAADLVTPAPENLTIVHSSPVQRVIMEGKKAVGVESNGNKYFASKEVIVCAGAFGTPKILMHSGIGPAKQLNEYKIPICKAVEAVGQGLRDHMSVPIIFSRKENGSSRNAFWSNDKAMEDALVQWKKDSTGPWAKHGCQLVIGFFKVKDLEKSKEFQDLPADEQRFMLLETVPHYEVVTFIPIHLFAPELTKVNYHCMAVWYYNAHSRGEATLQSSDPNVPLKLDPKFLAEPFDRRIAIESLRSTMRVTQHEAFAKDTIAQLVGPKSDSDEDLLDYWTEHIMSSLHMAGTAKMGKPGDSDAVVDTNFRVMGIEGLRIADMSVVPVLPSCHTQAVAYVTGITCAEKLVQEYGLA
ncbi:putative GMC oxidoreductase [Jackrogersella minutella]|nr:putative GMC oxidoreductase [Jackrogersella minutella]